MTKNRSHIGLLLCLSLFLINCKNKEIVSTGDFDQLSRVIEIGSWKYALHVENQNKEKGSANMGLSSHYLKATLYISNTKSNKSLLYSIAKDAEDYEQKYKYLSFESKEDLSIRYKGEYIYPIGYVFEPSNGLSNSEKLVYKFQINDEIFQQLKQDSKSVEYWYIDKLVGVGKICFKQQ